MNRSFRFYALIWAIFLAVWCAAAFLIRPVLPGFEMRYDARFWIAFGFIVAAFLGNLLCAYFAFQAEDPKKMFLNLPLVTVSWTALIVMLVLGSAMILIPNCPAWIAAIVCVVVIAFNAVAVIKAAWAGAAAHSIEQNVKAQTAFIKDLTVTAEGMLARAKSDEVKAECKKVYDAVRYSDPMSNDSLAEIEADISAKTQDLSAAVAADDAAQAKELADALIVLIGDRNNKCKALK